ncbi:hypothetical protein F5Y18DRAFT_223615 [Xylariaceae sp. FL1019]|nr:hypothetical protein F5Y18DRAFT_223615 [Xylariaceae sp. FL1019]
MIGSFLVPLCLYHVCLTLVFISLAPTPTRLWAYLTAPLTALYTYHLAPTSPQHFLQSIVHLHVPTPSDIRLLVASELVSREGSYLTYCKRVIRTEIQALVAWCGPKHCSQ